MMPLLSEVYKGRIESDQTRLGEYGGQKVNTQIVQAGVKFAAVDQVRVFLACFCVFVFRMSFTDVIRIVLQRDLEYDPQLYRRDRGELDWDARSMASTNVLAGDGASLYASKSTFYANSRSSSPAPPLPPSDSYNRYIAQGPGHHLAQNSEIEMSRIGGPSSDHLPLLTTQQGYFDGASAPVPQYPQQRNSPYHSPQSQYPPAPAMYSNESDGYRQAPIHRPYPHGRQMSNLSLSPSNAPAHNRNQSHYSQLSGGGEAAGVAGRGVFKG